MKVSSLHLVDQLNSQALGGLTTSFRSLKANLLLSTCVAITGIVVPIGLSFILIPLIDATTLQAFAAGAALCSTSLGTTFTVLQTSGLNVTRLGVVLTSAAMMDDVVGLVMVQVITNLSEDSRTFSAATVVRPVSVSIGFGLVVLVVCRYTVLPATKWINGQKINSPNAMVFRIAEGEGITFIIHTFILVGMVTGATYAGTSGLFAAYLAGAAINWWDNDIPHEKIPPAPSTTKPPDRNNSNPIKLQKVSSGMPQDGVMQDDSADQACGKEKTNKGTNAGAAESSNTSAPSPSDTMTSGIAIFEKYYYQPLHRILKPFFFASIGFSIPITRMFTGEIVWRGIIYAILMFIGKLVCGLWLVKWVVPQFLAQCWRPFSLSINSTKAKPIQASLRPVPTSTGNEALSSNRPTANSSAKLHPAPRSSHSSSNPAQPISVYPSLILGCAMVARGEIGFLVSSLAQSNGIFGEQQASPLFLIVTWAIVLCTIVGPIMVGIIVKRLNRLNKASNETRIASALGVWGVN